MHKPNLFVTMLCTLTTLLSLATAQGKFESATPMPVVKPISAFDILEKLDAKQLVIPEEPTKKKETDNNE